MTKKLNKKQLRTKAEILDNVLTFLQGACMMDTNFLQTRNPQREIFLRFHVHGMLGFAVKYLHENEIVVPSKSTDFLRKWDINAREVLSPLYTKTIQEMKDQTVANAKPDEEIYS